MAEHIRTKHRNRIAALIDAATTATVRVSPAIMPDEAALPTIDVETATDGLAAADNGSWPVQFREHDVLVKLYVKAAGPVSNTMDNILADIVAAVAADPTLNGNAKLCRLLDEEPERDELELPVGVITQTWRVLYRVNATNPTTYVA
jgi:hypothetical protein